MSTDLRTELNDCDNVTGFVGDGGTPSLNTLTGQRYEGSGAIDTQHSDTDEQMHTTQTSGGGGTFSLDLSDSTLYLLVKDNLVDTVGNGGVQFVVGDGTDLIGYDVGGNDAVGLALAPFYNGYKLDMSNRPGAFNVYTGVEANLTDTAITQMGYGSLHLAKAQGNVANVFLDRMTHIANDSHALRINAGTSGTPETMADVAGDDVTNGWGMVNNPLGKQYGFFAPVEWGEPAAAADHYFKADDEQWFLIGNNAGGHAVGATHFPFRLVSNATDTGSFVLNNVVIVNTGTRAELLMDDANFDTIELNGCTLLGLATVGCPSAGGTNREVLTTIFNNCDQVTHNGAPMNGSSVLLSNVAADIGALLYNESADPDGEMDDMLFSQGAAAHHAVDFGTAVTSDITLRGLELDGFSGTDDVDGSTFRFLAASGSLNLNLIDCLVDGSAATLSNIGVDDAAGITVTVVISPVTTLVHIDDPAGADLQNVRVLLEAADGAGDLPFEDIVTITRSGATASVAHTAHGMVAGDIVVIRNAEQQEYNGPFAITNISTNAYDYTVSGSPATPATGHPNGRVVDLQVGVDYDNSPTTEGVFEGGSGHVIFDTITLESDITVLVLAETSGVVTNFRVDSIPEQGPDVRVNQRLAQVSTDGSGVGFSITPDVDNFENDILASGAFISGLTDVNGDISRVRSIGTDTAVKGNARLSTTSPRFKSLDLAGNTVDNLLGLTINARMISDE